MEHWLNTIKLYDCLHGCRANRRTGTAVIKAKMAQQLSYLELKPLYGVFLDLKKAFNSMDWDCCIMILEGYGAGPRMIWLIQTYWHNAIMICCASGNYSTLKGGCGVTQGGPLSAKLLNILATEGTRTPVDLPEVKGCVGRVWDEHTCRAHHGSLADDCGVHSNPTGSTGM